MTVHPDNRRPLAQGMLLLGICVVTMAAFVVVPAFHFELSSAVNIALHTLLETASVAVCLLVFSVGWATFGRERGSVVALVSAAFLGAAVLDFVHLLSYTGMPPLVTSSGGGKAIPTFMAARLLVALAMTVVAVMPRQRLLGRSSMLALCAAALAVAGTISAVSVVDLRFRALFFDARTGLTPLKVGLEYLIIGLDLVAAVLFARRLREPQRQPVVQLLVAVCLMALSEFALTLYTTPVDQYFNVGHVFKIIAYVLIWTAMFRHAVLEPYRALEHARAELVLGEEKYRLLFETTLDGILIMEPGNSVPDANPAACATLRSSQTELARLLGSAPQDDRAPGLSLLRDLLHRTGPARGEATLSRPDGSSFEAEFESVNYTDSANRKVVSVVFRDVTERNRARDEILRLNATLEERVCQRTAQLEAVNRELESFSHSVAHDLRAPLGAIQGFGSALAADLEGRLTERDQHYLDRIIHRGAEMTEMVDALLALTRLAMSSLEPEAVDIGRIAGAAVQNLREADPARRVDFIVEGALPAQGDPRLLRIAVENLVGNAWKFTSRQPQARIRVGSRSFPEGETAFFVEDNGAGFDMAAAGKLFRIFQRLHSANEYPGTGIGLANVSRIVELHGGRVWAEAQTGAGATFYFTLKAASGR